MLNVRCLILVSSYASKIKSQVAKPSNPVWIENLAFITISTIDLVAIVSD